MRKIKKFSFLAMLGLLTLIPACVRFQPDSSPSRAFVLPGHRPDGSVLLPNQWSLRPVGRQILLGDFPVNIAVHPAGRFAAVLHCGYGDHEVIVVDLVATNVVSRVRLQEAFYGLRFSQDGNRLVASGAGDEVIHCFSFNDGLLTDHREVRLRSVTERGIAAGLDISADGAEVYVASLFSHQVTRVDLPSGRVIAHIPVATNGITTGTPPRPSAADPDTTAATKRDLAQKDATLPETPYPYTCLLDEGRGRLFVSLWGQAKVVVLGAKTGGLLAQWPTQEHPNEMRLTRSGKYLYVANANRNTISVLDTETGRHVEVLVAALHPNVPPGSTPNSLALSPDETRLYVANADMNAIAVFDVSHPGHSRSLGFIPAGWYPTSVRVTPDGKHLLIANGKGILPKPNRHGPQPGQRDPPGSVREYIAGLFTGTLSVIALPPADQFGEVLARYTTEVYRCSPLQPNLAPPVRRPARNPIPDRPGDPCPIKYCLYILKENRTYDQVFGDLPQGNGDPSLCLFGEEITPNHHQLAREFVLLDNFYVESEVSADGHEWSMGAYATDFVEKIWPLSYGHNTRGKLAYPSEGVFKIAEPAGGYLWDRARAAGISYRSYGEFIQNGKNPGDLSTARLPTLQGHFDPYFRGWDMDYPDIKRAERFIEELRRFEQTGEMPRLQILRLPNDHTYGATAGKLTPRAMVADNDRALGMVVEAVSRSRFWPQTAIFVVEDDAQNGPDHIDAHRTIAFVISPFAKRGVVDSTFYSTSSMLRTMELILGLEPMSQFDAAATPMYHSFKPKPTFRSYNALPANVDLNEKNPPTAWGAELSAQMDFTREDAADDLLLNEVIWRSVRGPDHAMPAPVRAAFVFPHPEEEEE